VCQGDVRNAPIESLELKFPIRVEERALRCDSGGAGRFRGGLGLSTRVRNLVEGTWNLTMPGRELCPPWGLVGGETGGVGRFELQRAGSETSEPVNGARRPVPEGSIVRIFTGGGGGWGHPFDRPVADVQRDVAEGLVSRAVATEKFGVVFANGSARIDDEGTRQCRAAGRHAASPSHTSADDAAGLTNRAVATR